MSISYNSPTCSSKILLTSFDIWLPHHQSNSSDDLLGNLEEHYPHPHRLDLLRRLPVDIVTASQLIIERIEEIKPDAIACCGMAENRAYLTVESRASCQDRILHTSIDLASLIDGLDFTQISHDAGKFVCEGLYYEILNYLQSKLETIPCIFIHVPVLNSANRTSMISDFTQILSRI
ncbi:pyroglutamyl-peptidase I family protein [Merismopedia glauca]|uniref:Peptidase C15 n=1 Tax=Merismopedia glauca CCAP 1448/3 TaxID=1296344 RepID=A0A2T1C475_9CYAN|nr:peptidase C15 [Merismopedia glauca]PSB02923.1 peptidase C15 [Merismopedia glauca CCAP 1448/3]